MKNLFGFEVRESPLLPIRRQKIKLSADVDVSPEFRAEFDKWLLDTFGEEEIQAIFCSPQAAGLYGIPDTVFIAGRKP